MFLAIFRVSVCRIPRFVYYEGYRCFLGEICSHKLWMRVLYGACSKGHMGRHVRDQVGIHRRTKEDVFRRFFFLLAYEQTKWGNLDAPCSVFSGPFLPLQLQTTLTGDWFYFHYDVGTGNERVFWRALLLQCNTGLSPFFRNCDFGAGEPLLRQKSTTPMIEKLCSGQMDVW